MSQFGGNKKRQPVANEYYQCVNTFATFNCSLKTSVKIRYFSTKQSILGALFLALLPIALLVNLGLVAFYDDEAIRALVAMEMKISGNFITPTMFGEFYYNKPPLYNWILYTVFELTKRNDEFISRLMTVIFLLVYSGSVYYFFKKNLPSEPGNCSPFTIRHLPLLSALALITCGRILFWESMLGLIDMCFSWVIFLMLMVIYQEGEKNRYGRLYFYTYFLGAVGYMLKGLPAVAFLAIALLTYFVWQKKVKQLFSIKHFLGVILFVVIIGGYYFLYSQQNGLETIFKTVFHESAKRTLVEYGLGETFLHFFSFPVEMWYHFLPWTFLVVCFLRKDFLGILNENKFISWNILVFITTVFPYWLSVEVYPRYLLMHVPLVFSALIYFYLKSKKEEGWQADVVEKVFFAAACLSVLAALLPIGWEKAEGVPFKHIKSIGIAATLLLLCVLYWKWKDQRMLIFVIVLLAARTGYNFFILPSRVKIECSTHVRETTEQAVEMAAGEPIYIYKNSLGFQPMTGYYFTRSTNKILEKKHGKPEWGVYYLVHPGNYDASIFKKYGEVKIKWECGSLWFMKKRPIPKK